MAITARQSRTTVRPCLLMNTILLDGFLCSEHEPSSHGGVLTLSARSLRARSQNLSPEQWPGIRSSGLISFTSRRPVSCSHHSAGDDMEATYNGMDVLDARDGFFLADCVDDTAMAGLNAASHRAVARLRHSSSGLSTMKSVVSSRFSSTTTVSQRELLRTASASAAREQWRDFSPRR